jgi:hypothetical protein
MFKPFLSKKVGMFDNLGILFFRAGQDDGTMSMRVSLSSGLVGHGSLPCLGKNKGNHDVFEIPSQ